MHKFVLCLTVLCSVVMSGCSSNKYVTANWKITLPEGWRAVKKHPHTYFSPHQGYGVAVGEYIKKDENITDTELKQKTNLYEKFYKDLKPISFGKFRGYSYESTDLCYRKTWYLAKDNVMVIVSFNTSDTDKQEGEKEIKEIENMLKTLKIRK